MSCTYRHTSLDEGGVWRLGENSAVGIMTDLAGQVTWHTKCLLCGILSDPVPAKVAMRWGVPSFDITFTSRSILGEHRTLMPKGWYTAKITAVEQVKVKKAGPNQGKPMYKITCSVVEGNYTGRALNKWVCLFAPAWRSYEEIAKALDWEIEKNKAGEPIPRPAKDLQDQVLAINVTHEPDYSGEELTAAIKSFAKAGSDPTRAGKVRIRI